MVLNPLSTFLHQFYSGNLVNFAGTTFILFSSLHVRTNCCIAAIGLSATPTVVFLY